jgi:hypothetical protein
MVIQTLTEADLANLFRFAPEEKVGGTAVRQGPATVVLLTYLSACASAAEALRSLRR